MAKRIKLLGSLIIEENGRTSPLTKSAKGCALLAYLAVTGEPQPRETIADLLWEATTASQSLRNLRVLLTRIRPWMPELHVTRTTVTLQPRPDLTIDLLTLTDALQSQEVATLDEGLRSYSGHLLTGFYLRDAPRFNEWLLFTRERLWQQVTAAFERVCEDYVARQLWNEGEDAASHWLTLDDLDERAYRWLMICLAGKGRLSQALQQYNVCRQRLWQELEVEPELATSSLAEQLGQTLTETDGAVTWDALIQQNWPQPDELAEPGPLPVNALIPYRRNNDFTGREEGLLRLAELLLPWPDGDNRNNRPTAVTGMGGVGKTQLAVEFCYRYGRFFPGSVYWLNFDEAENVAEEVARIGGERGMGLYQETEQLTLADKVGRVQKAWQEPTPRLLIFDNCEAEKLLADWLPVTGGCRVLVTSRRGHWSRELEINTLSLKVLNKVESLTLLQRLAPRLNKQEAIEVAAEIGHLPLALHLAGGFLRRYELVSPAQYLSQLRDKGLLQHPSLQGRGLAHSPTDHELHVALTFALNITQLDLNDDVDAIAQQLLLCAACFAPGEPIPLVLLRETVVSAEDDLIAMLLAEDGLGRLIALGFLQSESGETVVLHRLLAVFILEEMTTDQLIDAAQTAVEDAMIHHLHPILDNLEFQGSLTVPIIHLRHVIETALARSSEAVGLLTLAVGRYLRSIGEFSAAQLYLEKGMETAKATDDTYTQGRIMVVLNRVYFSQGFHNRANDCAMEAERLLRLANVPDQGWLMTALIRQGWVYLRLGQAEPALEKAEAVRKLSIDTSNETLLFQALNLLGSIKYFLQGKYKEADHYFEEAIALLRETGREFGLATTIMNLGESASTQGDYQRGKALIEEALAIMGKVGNRLRELSFLINYSEAMLHLGEYDTAVDNLTLVLAEAPKNWTYRPPAYYVLAEAYLRQGQADQALTTIQKAFADGKTSNDPFDTGQAWRVLGIIAAQQEHSVPVDPAQNTTYDAPTCFARCLAIFTEIDNQRERALVLSVWGTYELAKGDAEKGRTMVQEADEILTRLDLPLLKQVIEKERLW
ncbi:MAG: BTAD domain-containing putative transcriptional regulator [Candidatus Promineifilaceae bacterium]